MVVVPLGSALAHAETEAPNVVPQYGVRIGVISDAAPGWYCDIPITLTRATDNIKSFNFLISYDPIKVRFVEAFPGEVITGCGWEYFTYRSPAVDLSQWIYPISTIRVVGFAEVNNGPDLHPTCNLPDSLPATLAVLRFVFDNNEYCRSTPLRFTWADCGDNIMTPVGPDTVYMSRFVSDQLWWDRYADITDNDFGMPGWYGAPTDPCLIPDRYYTLRSIDFVNGEIALTNGCTIDIRGDININGVFGEISDVIMFRDYFLYGLTAFGPHVEASILASDVNADSIGLTLADFVYLVGYIFGRRDLDSGPPYSPTLQVKAVATDDKMTIKTHATAEIGAILLVFHVKGSTGTPTTNTFMDVDYSTNASELRVMIYNIGKNKIPAGHQEVLTIPFDGTLELVSVEAAEYYGRPMRAIVNPPTDVDDEQGSILPRTPTLSQNHPNPFNPTTTIEYTLPRQAQVSIDLFSIDGRKVRTLISGIRPAGDHSIIWDGCDDTGNPVSTGIYFYRLRAGNDTLTRKLLLLK